MVRPQVVNSNMSYLELNETFSGGNNNAVLIPVRYDIDGKLKEYFLLENYHTTNSHVCKSILNQQPFLTTSFQKE
ncbi:MAG: hypothetical protein IPN18_11445 [Ignavibacteriales bacterium]|nr:hypothetical protein [Ignavibacteriales bacterium]